MTVRDVMTPNVVSVTPDTTAREAAQIMRRHDHAAVPVVDDEGHVLGMFTEGDLLRLALPKHLESIGDLGFLPEDFEPFEHPRDEIKTALVRDLLTRTDVHVAEAGEHVAEVARLICQERVRRVPVVEDGRLVGIVTRADLIERIVLPTLLEE